MKILSIAVLLTLAFAGSTLGQTFSDTVAKVRQIKLLHSTREDVKRILHENEATDDEDHYQEFSKGDLRIEVTYSSGTCTEDSDEDDASEIWSVKEWTVTRIEVSLEVPMTLRESGLNLSTFKKEPRYAEDTDSFVFHSKAAGLAVKTYENEVKRLIFFPPRAGSNKLCRNTTSAKGFYTRKGWFSLADPYDYSGCINYTADVTELNLGAVELDLSASSTIEVNTTAIDPENDVLTYNYTVSAGRIVGTGANVVWELSDASPGSYTITAAVDDGCGLCGKTVTKTVVVK